MDQGIKTPPSAILAVSQESTGDLLRAALARCQVAAGNVPPFVRPHLTPLSDLLAVLVMEVEELQAGLADLRAAEFDRRACGCKREG